MMEDCNYIQPQSYEEICWSLQTSTFSILIVYLSQKCYSYSYFHQLFGYFLKRIFHTTSYNQRCCEFSGISNSVKEEQNIGGFSAFKNVGKPTKERILGTAGSPIHMVATEVGSFKDQMWRLVRSLAVVFLLISGVGALIEDKGISKGIAMSL